jgi:hypothetical protein
VILAIGILAIGTATSARTAERPADAHCDFVANQSDDQLVVLGTTKIKWKAAVASQVIAEGIAWSDSKGFGDRVILDGTSIFLEAPEEFGVKNHGRLVEVRGVLTRKVHKAGPKTSQGFGSDVCRYTLENARWKFIEKAASPYLREDQ